MTKLLSIMRYPLKSHGREALDNVALTKDQSLPFDRQWAVAHEGAKATGTTWASCQNFMRVAGSPKLAAITAQLDETKNLLTLRHPELPQLVFNPDKDEAAFLKWVAPLIASHRAQPKRIVRIEGSRGFTDSAFASVTLCNVASHRAVEHEIGQTLSMDRWRGNLWVDTGTAWEEFDWIGREIALGTSKLKVVERTERCMTTAANPETGMRDADVLGALDRFGHQDFSMLATVVESGHISVGDDVRVM